MYEYIYGDIPTIPALLEEINENGLEIVSVFYSTDSQQVHFIVRTPVEESAPEEPRRLFGGQVA